MFIYQLIAFARMLGVFSAQKRIAFDYLGVIVALQLGNMSVSSLVIFS
jgi:hypothetical protein